MCFSASASFTAAAILVGIGTCTTRSVRAPSEWPFAAIPFLFAVQQCIEGALWLRFHHDSAVASDWLVQSYVLFSHVLWPVFVPLSVSLIEPQRLRRRWLGALVVAGVALSAWLFDETFVHGVTARPNGAHIDYESRASLASVSASVYVLTTAVSLLLSSHRAVRRFGVLTLIAFTLTYAFYETWLVSVWCFFAAWLSAVVLLHFRRADGERLAAGA